MQVARNTSDAIKTITAVFSSTPVYSAVHSSESEWELVKALQFLFWVLEENSCPEINAAYEAIREAFNLSPFINVTIAKHGQRILFYPRGARLLDEAAIDDTLAWLDRYPTVADHFAKALKYYYEKDVEHYRNLLDELRVALEQLVQRLLGNNKTLENNKSLLFSWLEKRKIHQALRKFIKETVFGTYMVYQNDAVKHREAWKPKEIEFNIYLIGTCMRFLLQLA